MAHEAFKTISEFSHQKYKVCYNKEKKIVVKHRPTAGKCGQGVEAGAKFCRACRAAVKL